MNDEIDKTATPKGSATPNRGKRREAPILEGKATETDPPQPAAVAPETAVPEPAAETVAPDSIAAEAIAVETAAAEKAAAEKAEAERIAAEKAAADRAAQAAGARRTIAPDAYARDWPAPAAPARPSLLATLPGLAGLLLGGAALYIALDPPGPDPVSADAMAATMQRVDRLESRFTALETKPAPALPALPPPPDLSPLNARIDAATRVAEAARADAGRALQAAQNPPRPPDPPRVDLAPLDQRIGRLEAKLDSELGPLRAALTAPKTDVRATEAPDAPGLNGQAVAPRDAAATAVVAGALIQQLDRGAPFAREVGVLEKLGVDPARLARLKPLAASGAPSVASLAQEFAPLSSAMLRAARPAGAAGGDLMDRIARSASNLVRIRPAGETPGEDAPALVGRIEGAMQRGSVRDALAAYDRLPDDVKAPARDWATRARQRVEADDAAQSLRDDALDTLARK